MSVKLVSNQKIAETSSKGNQENGWTTASGTNWISLVMRRWPKPFLPCFWNTAISKEKHRSVSSDTIWKGCWFMGGSVQAAAVRIS